MVTFNATFFAQVLNFLILVLIIAKFAYKPLLKTMEERKEKIAADLRTAAAAEKETEEIKAKYAAKLAEAKTEAQAIIDNARKTAQAAHDKIMADTKAEQEQVIAAAKEAIALEQKKSLEQIRAQVIELSMAVAGKIVEQKLGSEEDKALAGKITDSLMK